MKLEKLEEIRTEIKKIEDSNKNAIDNAAKELTAVNTRLSQIETELEETFNTGDTRKGEQLIKEKLELTEKASYLNTFIKKRQSIKLITEDQAKAYVKEIYNYLNGKHTDAEKQLKKCLQELSPVIADVRSANNKGKELVNYIYANLLRDSANVFVEDVKRMGYYSSFAAFENNLKSRGL